MICEEHAELSRLLGSAAPTPSMTLESVKIETLDDFCLEHEISHIGFLKIDTEGNDLNVLRGGKQILSQQRIDVVQVEAGMNPANKRQVPYNSLCNFLEARNYLLFGIYDQVSEWPQRKPHLRRANPVFISREVISANVGRL